MGSQYPMYLEKLAFLGLLILAIYSGNMLSDHLSGYQLWLSWICGIPILLFVVAEFVGRIIQKVHIR